MYNAVCIGGPQRTDSAAGRRVAVAVEGAQGGGRCEAAAVIEPSRRTSAQVFHVQRPEHDPFVERLLADGIDAPLK